jgi:hypothetical protein
MKIKHIHIFFAIAIIMGGGIFLSSQMGLFHTTRAASVNPVGAGRQMQATASSQMAFTERQMQTDLNKSQSLNMATEDTEKLAGDVHDVINIRGSYTLAEIERLFQVPPAAIIESFSLQEDTDPRVFRLRDLKILYEDYEIDGEIYEVETDTIKVFVSLYTNKPYTSDETFYLPEKAVNYLLRENRLTPEEESYWKAHTFDLEAYARDSHTIQAIAEESGPASFTGNTTIAGLISMGMDEETFKEITGFEVPEDRTITIRNFIFAHGLGFDDVSEEIEEFFRIK